MTVDLVRLRDADQIIQEIARDFGLDFYPQEFDIVPYTKMIEIEAYHLPTNYNHWSHGRDYEAGRTKYDHGASLAYEVVLNNDPCRAYLMETNPFAVQALVIAHVYAHNDFFKNNVNCRAVRSDMITSAIEATNRFRHYEELFGIEEVEKLIDDVMAIMWHVDVMHPNYRETEQKARDRLYGWKKELPLAGQFDDLLPRKRRFSRKIKKKLQKKVPPEPTIDLVGFIIEHSPRQFDDWELDILSTIKQQAIYFSPNMLTKTMNEGWAVYWHEKIIEKLFEQNFLSSEEMMEYRKCNSAVKSSHRNRVNPYLLGSAIFKSIKDRWDRGRFGREFDECRDREQREKWNTNLGLGNEKIFEVRSLYRDWSFVYEFLDRDTIEELEMFVYLEKDKRTHYEVEVEEVEWKKVKEILLHMLMNFSVPKILVLDGNHKNSNQLSLRHVVDKLPLDTEYCEKTLEHIYSLWERTVHLETKEEERKKVYSCNGKRHKCKYHNE